MIETVKQFPELSGIYKITSPTGRIYIGESRNLKKRCIYYTNPRRVKGQSAIYNSLISHTPEKHTIEILELCDESILLQRERYYQELYDSVNNGLNCLFTSTDNKKMVWSEDTIKKMSNNQLGENNSFFWKKTHNRVFKKNIK